MNLYEIDKSKILLNLVVLTKFYKILLRSILDNVDSFLTEISRKILLFEACTISHSAMMNLFHTDVIAIFDLCETMYDRMKKLLLIRVTYIAKLQLHQWTRK